MVGFGNLLQSDDGVGGSVIERLQSAGLPEGVEAVDGGVASFAVLSQVGADIDRVVVIDAMMGGGSPGDIYRLEEGELADGPATGACWSLHDLTLADTLRQLRLIGPFPPVTLFGVEPESIAPGVGLSDAVARTAAILPEIILREIAKLTD